MSGAIVYGGTTGGFFGQMLYYLYTNGFYSAVLPFFVMFILIYAAVSRVHLFKNNVAMSSLLALILALLVIMPYSVQDQANPLYGVTPAFISALMPVSIAIIAIVLVMLIFEFLGGEYKSDSKWGAFVTITVSLIVLVGIIIALMKSYNVSLSLHWPSMGGFGSFWAMLFSPAVFSAIVMLTFFALFVVLILRGIGISPSKPSKPSKPGK